MKLMSRFLCSLLFSMLMVAGVSGQGEVRTFASPNQKVVVTLRLTQTGELLYRVQFNRKTVVDWSQMGIRTQEADFSTGFQLQKASVRLSDTNWQPVWGEVATIRNHYYELLYSLTSEAGLKMDLRLRAYDNGFAFRYEFPEDNPHKTLHVTDDLSSFRMTGDHTAWWIPGDYDSNEHVYSTTALKAINTDPYAAEQNIVTQHIVDRFNVQTPLTMRTADGVHLSIAEAALVDFAGMHLRLDTATLTFNSFLIPSPDPAVKSVNTLPFHTPWRALLISPDAAGLLNSKLILNLNEPTQIEDVSWIKPQKYVGIWWEMHVGTGTWDYSGSQDMSSATGRKPHGKHSATTANTKRYIDFAAKYGFDGVLVEGWNEGWENWFNQMKDEVFSFTTPYPDYDMDELSRYAREKGVRIIMHHETSSAVNSYERQMDEAYAYMKKHDINTVKTGYVGKIIPRGEWHDGQWMVNHYVRVAERTAQNQIMLNAHEPVRPSGLHRTYPNWLACEAARGNEFNAWSKGNPPEHETILPFTRLLGGPMDYTPGIFEPRMNTYDPKKTEVVHTTVAKQLALYVTLYSPLQMAADLPENYEKRLDVFQFIRDVPVDWSDIRVLDAAIGDHITIARKEKGGDNWYLGSITDENARAFDVEMNFLEEGKTYEATIYADGADAHWENNPYPVSISTRTVVKGDSLPIRLAAGGGCAVAIKIK